MILLFNKAIANDLCLLLPLEEQGKTDITNLKMSNGAYNNGVLKAVNASRDEDIELDEDLLDELNEDYTVPTVELPDITLAEEEIKEDENDFNFDEEAEDAKDLRRIKRDRNINCGRRSR